MKALKLEKTGVLNLIQAPLPEAGPGEVLLNVSYCALCRTDAKMFQQGQRDLVLPRILGHEIYGYEEKSGKNYVVWPGKACGACSQCRRGSENLCPNMHILGFHEDGGLAEAVVVPQTGLIPVPEDLPGHLACLAEPLACGMNALEQARVSGKEKILIYGGGPVGLMLALAAQTRGAEPFVLEKNPSKFERSASFRQQTGIKGGLECLLSEFDVIINAAPSSETFAHGIPKLISGGCFCLFSGLTSEYSVPVSLLNEIHYRQLHVTGAYGCTREQMRKALHILSEHGKSIASLIEEQISPERVPSVLEKVLSGQVMKFIVQF